MSPREAALSVVTGVTDTGTIWHSQTQDGRRRTIFPRFIEPLGISSPQGNGRLRFFLFTSSFFFFGPSDGEITTFARMVDA